MFFLAYTYTNRLKVCNDTTCIPIDHRFDGHRSLGVDGALPLNSQGVLTGYQYILAWCVYELSLLDRIGCNRALLLPQCRECI